ncbi:hypothetical protein [Vibrio crassostreae]|uniref:hypothetical protein n=2 Tax=Vibrio crassostreae TaxID=246167 RepID=UPI001B30EF30|nr:hypothetical protein [Vibrio crassostreae]
MKSRYWKEEDLTPASKKMAYLRAYTLKNGRLRGLREVEIERLAYLTMDIDTIVAVAYFEELPSNFQKAFKTAWRQHQHKKKACSTNSSIELTWAGKDVVARMVELYTERHPECVGEGLPVLRALALRWFLDTHCQEGVDRYERYS